MITEDYVSFETAKLLKEKGFDWEESPFYSEQDRDEWQQQNSYTIPNPAYNPDIPFDWETQTVVVPHISLQVAMKWLREVHDLHIDIFVTYKDGIPHYQWSVDNLKTQDTISETPCCNAYEEACEAAIKYCLGNLI